MKPIKIIIVDDHALFRIGERAVITEDLPDAQILAEYSSGEELLVHLQSGVLPDIVLLDIVLEGMTGVEVAKVLKEKYPDIKIIILSSEIEPALVVELLDIGINAYLSKLSVKKDLVNAIRSVNKGNLFYGKNIAHIIYDSVAAVENKKEKKTLWRRKEKKCELSDREEQIIRLFCDGFSMKEIAEKLSVSKRTIENHKSNIMKKMDFKTSVDIIKYAVKHGIIKL